MAQFRSTSFLLALWGLLYLSGSPNSEAQRAGAGKRTHIVYGASNYGETGKKYHGPLLATLAGLHQTYGQRLETVYLNDLPHSSLVGAVAVAREFAAKEKWSTTIEVAKGDYLKDALPRTHTASLSNPSNDIYGSFFVPFLDRLLPGGVLVLTEDPCVPSIDLSRPAGRRAFETLGIFYQRHGYGVPWSSSWSEPIDLKPKRWVFL